MNPLRGSSENSKGLTGPETVGGTPVSNIRNEFLCVLVQALNVEFPLKSALIGLDVLQENASPLRVGNALMNSLDGLSRSELFDIQVPCLLNVLSKFLVCLVVSVVKRTAIQAHNTGESVHMVNGCGSGDLSTETVTANGSKGDLVLVHVSHDIV